jgi:hypothetical protein
MKSTLRLRPIVSGPVPPIFGTRTKAPAFPLPPRPTRKAIVRRLRALATVAPGQTWPGHRRLHLGGAVLRPILFRSALRGR